MSFHRLPFLDFFSNQQPFFPHQWPIRNQNHLLPMPSSFLLFQRLLLLVLVLLLFLTQPILSQNSSSPSSNTSSACPLDFSVLQKFVSSAAATSPSSISSGNSDRCDYLLQFLHLVLAQFLFTKSLFHPPLDAAASCWAAFQTAIGPLFSSAGVAPFDVRATCGFRTEWIAQGCMNISTRADFEAKLPTSAIHDMELSCNQSLAPVPACTACTVSLSRVKAAYLPGPDYGNVSDCTSYPSIYGAGAISLNGPSDDANANCYFLLTTNATAAPSSSKGGPSTWIYVVAAICLVLLLAIALSIWFWIRRRRVRRQNPAKPEEVTPSPALESISASTTLIKFTFDEIKKATRNFSRDNIIGRGGYGNVYKGVLRDGTEVALKRFKNCSAAGDASFAHEVEVIASVRHVNLLALKGYCIATTQMEGHQRIIVCDLMHNGSLHDHLFGTENHRLSWSLRQQIAVGMARGLAYLHDSVQPSIIHRDIKASNILLDDKFVPKVADFGLAKFAPEGMSHVSTRVAGTLGYVAPEYALYGQLTEKSDVYSFGVVLLELLSGKKAFVSMGEGQAFVVSDWAWSLVRRGRALAVVEEGMEELGPKEVLEKYVHVAVLCTHPQLHARPTMNQIVKILETDLSVPSIPDRPIPIVSNIEEIERSVSSSGSGQLSSFAGYQAFSYGNDDANSNDSEQN